MFTLRHRENNLAKLKIILMLGDKRISIKERDYPLKHVSSGVNAEIQDRMNAGFSIDRTGLKNHLKYFQNISVIFVLIDVKNRVDHPPKFLHGMAYDRHTETSLPINKPC